MIIFSQENIKRYMDVEVEVEVVEIINLNILVDLNRFIYEIEH
jgi:hypothetical protein